MRKKLSKLTILFLVIISTAFTLAKQYNKFQIEITKPTKQENTCRVQDDCQEMNNCVNGLCKHKDFFPPSIAEIIGAVLIIVGSALSNAGGIGGGGLLVPILILYLNFNTKEAIPISKLMIFTGSLTACLMGLKNKNPYRDATAIDFNIAIVVIPLILFGTMIGVTLNKIFPPSIILICLTLILVINTYKTIRKGLELYEKEKKGQTIDTMKKIKLKAIKSGDNSNNETEEEESTGLIDLNETVEVGDNLNLQEFNSITRKVLLNIEFEKDKVLLPFNKILFCLISYLMLLIVTFLKGSDHFNSILGVTTCTPLYWAIYLSYLPICIVITFIVGRMVYEEYNYRREIGYPFHFSDIKWSKELIIKYPLYALSAGILSGLLGIGGGLILGPLLLDLGIHPLVSSATSNFLVVFISSSTTLQYIVLGMMNFNYGFVCTILSTFGSYIGTYLIQKYMEKTKKSSILVFILAAVLGFSTIFIPSHTFIQMIKKIKEGVNIWQFHSPC